MKNDTTGQQRRARERRLLSTTSKGGGQMQYITVAKAAEQSSMKADVIRDMLRKHEIAGAVKVRRSWRLPGNWLEQFEEVNDEVQTDVQTRT